MSETYRQSHLYAEITFVLRMLQHKKGSPILMKSSKKGSFVYKKKTALSLRLDEYDIRIIPYQNNVIQGQRIITPKEIKLNNIKR